MRLRKCHSSAGCCGVYSYFYTNQGGSKTLNKFNNEVWVLQDMLEYYPAARRFKCFLECWNQIKEDE